MRAFTRSSTSVSPVSLLTKTAIGTPQARWREITQSGRCEIMPVMRFWPEAGSQRTLAISSSATSRSDAPAVRHILAAVRPPEAAIGLSIAMNHCGVLRKMTGFFERQEVRILMLEASARDERTGIRPAP